MENERFTREEIDEMSVEDLREWVYALDRLVSDRYRMLDAIPECPSHGACVPHALAWIEAARAAGVGPVGLPVISAEDVLAGMESGR